MSQFDLYGKNTFLRSIKLVLRKIGLTFESFFLFSFSKSFEISLKPANIKGEIKSLDISNYSMNSQNYNFPKKSRITKFSNRFDSGHHSYGFFHEKRLLYYCWVSDTTFQPINFGQKLSNGQAMIFDVACDNDYRRLGIHRHVISYLLSQFMESDKREIILLANKDNIAAISSYQSIGFIKKKLIKQRRYFGRDTIKISLLDK